MAEKETNKNTNSSAGALVLLVFALCVIAGITFMSQKLNQDSEHTAYDLDKEQYGKILKHDYLTKGDIQKIAEDAGSDKFVDSLRGKIAVDEKTGYEYKVQIIDGNYTHKAKFKPVYKDGKHVTNKAWSKTAVDADSSNKRSSDMGDSQKRHIDWAEQ